MIGNDIVDLNLAGVHSRWREHRFLDKLFSESEQSFISDTNCYITIWRLWSMKESAYKIWARNRPSLFNPKFFECNIFSEALGSVSFDGHTAHTTTTNDSIVMYTLAQLNDTAIINKVMPLDSFSMADKNRVLKEKAIEAFSELKLIPKKSISIEKNTFGAPQFLIHQKGQRNVLTLTHHGKYGGFAIAY